MAIMPLPAMVNLFRFTVRFCSRHIIINQLNFKDMNKRKLFLQYAKQIKDLGYTVYISADEYYNYGYIVNKNNSICYFQLSDFFEVLDDVHVFALEALNIDLLDVNQA